MTCRDAKRSRADAAIDGVERKRRSVGFVERLRLIRSRSAGASRKQVEQARAELRK